MSEVTNDLDPDAVARRMVEVERQLRRVQDRLDWVEREVRSWQREGKIDKNRKAQKNLPDGRGESNGNKLDSRLVDLDRDFGPGLVIW